MSQIFSVKTAPIQKPVHLLMSMQFEFWMKEIIILYRHYFKGYLRYKTITSQNISSEAQVKNFFILQKSCVPFSRFSSFRIFNHPIIYQICDAIMSIRTWDSVYFWICHLNHNLLSHQTWLTDIYKEVQ